MLLKLDTRKNSGDIKISNANKMIRLKRVARNLQWGEGCFGDLEAEFPAIENFVYFWQKLT